MSTSPCPLNCVRVTNNMCECIDVIDVAKGLSPSPSPMLSSTSPSPGPCPSNCVRVNNICECTGVIGLPSPMLSSTSPSPSPSPSTPWYKNTYIIIGIVLVILLFLTGSGVLAIYLSKSKSTTKSK